MRMKRWCSPTTSPSIIPLRPSRAARGQRPGAPPSPVSGSASRSTRAQSRSSSPPPRVRSWTARFAFRRTGTGLDFYLVTLADVLVTHIVQRAGAGAQYPLSFDTLTLGADTTGFLDEVTLSYSKIQWEYHPVTATGAPGLVVKGGWDLRLNQQI